LQSCNIFVAQSGSRNHEMPIIRFQGISAGSGAV
jgi:hypothetical protein